MAAGVVLFKVAVLPEQIAAKVGAVGVEGALFTFTVRGMRADLQPVVVTLSMR